MPTVSVSIRNEDYDAWRKLESPAEFIHNALNGAVAKLEVSYSENVPSNGRIETIPAREKHPHTVINPSTIKTPIEKAAQKIQEMDKTLTTKQKADFLGEAYQTGHTAYVAALKAKKSGGMFDRTGNEPIMRNKKKGKL